MALKAKKPKQTAEEASLLAAQTREIDRQDIALNEKKRLLIRSQLSSRASLLSGNVRQKQQMLPGGGGGLATGIAGRTGAPTSSGGGGGTVGAIVQRRKLPSKVTLLD